MNNKKTSVCSKRALDSLCLEHIGICFLDIFLLSDLNLVDEIECLVSEAMMN